MADAPKQASRVRGTLRRALPVVVTTATLGWVFYSFDMRKVVEALSWRVVAVMIPALVAYGAATLLLESWSLLRVIPRAKPGFGAWTAARVKCASYLVAIVNYFLGGAALTVLLSRRAGLGLGGAASVVLLVSMTDLIVVLAFGSVAAATQTEAGGPTVRAGLVAMAGIGFLAGLILLRADRSLGPLDRIRSLSVFEALRITPASRLAELAALRTVFSICFIGVAGATFYAFDVEISTSRLVVGTMILAIIGAIPWAVAGLGPSQMATVVVFEGVADPEVLIALSLVLAAGLIALRAVMGTTFAREYTREALAEARKEADLGSASAQ
ncbi:MAG: lysylphosphatidylglycerol synthase domain-containing protein [Myxococcota bacterium]|nr:lysylphosphatidylglycerol synthase domain-containing protein [Myxococcota bacterium]